MSQLDPKDAAPRPLSLVRLAVTALILLAAAIASFGFGWWPLGIVCVVVLLALVAACVALGALFVRIGFRAHSNAFIAVGHKGMKRARHSGPQLSEEELAERRRIDEQVGFLLTVDDPPMVNDLSETDRARIWEHRLALRSSSYAWLTQEGAPTWQDVSIDAEDGVRLVGHVLACNPESPRWVVLAHGYAGSYREMVLYARHWAQRGFNLLAPDMRGHGASAGRYVGMGWLDRRDLLGWVRWLVSERGEGVRVVLHGHSMGAASVCLAAGEPDVPAQVVAVVSDCAYSSAWAMSALLLDTGVGLPVHPTLDLVRLNLRARRGGYDLARADVVAAVGRIRVPLVLLHGAQDSIVPAEMAQELRVSYKGPRCSLLVAPGAGHCQALLSDPQAYWDAVDPLVEDALLAAPVSD